MTVPPQKPPINSLSLSGGGFRAAFFHFGALHALAEAGRLRHMKLLTTVSGGSIAAAFFLQAVQKAGPSVWEDSVNLADCAITAYQDLFTRSRMSPRAQVLSSIRSLCQGLVRNEWGFSKALIRMMKRWFKDLASASEHTPPQTAGPEWRIAVTDYKSPRRVLLVCGTLGQPQSDGALYIDLVHKDLPIAIAASCAVPGVFEPVPFNDLLLGDGGILDNLGAHELKASDDHRVCVDASAEAAPLSHVEGWSTPMRAMDMLMDHDRALVIDAEVKVLKEVISLRDTRPCDQEWRVALRSIRTDLDDFTHCEACLLFLAGYQAARGGRFMPTRHPFDGTRQVWDLMELPDRAGASQTHKRRTARGRKSILAELERGKYGIGFGFRKPSATSILMSLGSFYLSLSVALIVAGYVIFGAAVSVMQLPTWLQDLPALHGAYASWLVASLWLGISYMEKRKLGFFGRARQIIGMVIGGALVPAVVLASILARCSLIFSVRELSLFTRDRAARLPL